jgi:hypothetical protein
MSAATAALQYVRCTELSGRIYLGPALSAGRFFPRYLASALWRAAYTGPDRRTFFACLSSRKPSYATRFNNPSAVQVRNLTSHTGSGRTQWTRERTSGDPNRVVRGDATFSGILEMRSGCSLSDKRRSSASDTPVPARPA